MKKFHYLNQTIYFKSSENMKELQNNSIDVIITSPPYNVGKDYSSNGKKYNDNQKYGKYLDFLERVFKECYRVASDKCVFFLNIGDSANSQGKSEDVVRRAVDAGFNRLQSIIWVKSIFGKGHYTPSGRDRRLNNLWEHIFVLYKTKKYQLHPKKIGIPYSDKSNIGRYAKIDKRDAGDLWFIPYVKTTGSTLKKGHEAPFPIELPYKCLNLVKDPGNILDPFAGTGSTLRAAEELKLKGYGYEILPRVEVIKQRLKEEISEIKIPLLPQFETYTAFMTDFVNKLLDIIPEEQTIKLLDEFNIVPRRHFTWAADDLDIQVKILKYLKNNKKIFPKDKFYLKKDEDSIKKKSVKLKREMNKGKNSLLRYFFE